MPAGAAARVQIAPDGIHWTDKGTEIAVSRTPGPTTFARVRHFGGWLRLTGSLPAGVAVPVIVHLTLKE